VVILPSGRRPPPGCGQLPGTPVAELMVKLLLLGVSLLLKNISQCGALAHCEHASRGAAASAAATAATERVRSHLCKNKQRRLINIARSIFER